MFQHEHLTRQLDLIPPSVLGTKITVIGAGAIGGWTVLSLAKMGFADITVYDFDKVEVENLGSQIYGRKHLGMPKAEALKQIVEELTGIQIEAKNARYESGRFAGIVIAAVDSMSARSKIYSEHRVSPHTKALIDPRMGAETALLYVLDPAIEKERTSYEKTLYSDEEAVREPCTRKATAYCALSLSGLVGSQVKAVATGSPRARVTQWDIPKAGFQGWMTA